MKMIERWFPTEEVSEASATGWGSGNAEKRLLTWFAARPLVQAKAAVLTSLLPWPENEPEQKRLTLLVRQSLSGLIPALVSDPVQATSLTEKERAANRTDADTVLKAVLGELYPNGARILDPFSGRAMIPLEAAKLDVRAHGIDYSPVATLAGRLLAEYPFRDWSGEPPLSFANYSSNPLQPRLLHDVDYVLAEVGRRFQQTMAEFYPKVNGIYPWGYLWAVTLPCESCGRRFPLVGSFELRRPDLKKNDPGQSFYIEADNTTGQFGVVIHDGTPLRQPIRRVAPGKHKYDSSGKVAVCPFCGEVHKKDTHTRLATQGLGNDVLLLVADLDKEHGKRFRLPTEQEVGVLAAVKTALADEQAFGSSLSTVPDELIPPGNTRTIQPLVYGYKSYGELCNARQTLGFVRLARIIADLGNELVASGIGDEYTRALCGYLASGLVRKLMRSTRGVTLEVSAQKVSNIYGLNESSISFSYDYFEVGIGEGPGTWASLSRDPLSVLTKLIGHGHTAGMIARGSALSLPFRSGFLDAVVTDPPYDDMINYSDASDIFYVWLRRALAGIDPDFLMTADKLGGQEKSEELVVYRGTQESGDHRTKQHFDEGLVTAFRECRRVVKYDGVVTVVFGHGDPDVWRRLLSVIHESGLVLTGTWPARTEKGGQEGSANITTTLTLACRPAPPNRPTGRAVDVRAEIRAAVFQRVTQSERDGLALTDQLMAAAGPAMEVAGRYSLVTDARGQPLDLLEFVKTARQAVEEHTAIQIEDVPLSAFDPRTRFALFWVRVHGRSIAPKSDARWQAMAAELTLDDLKGVLYTPKSGVRFAMAAEVKPKITTSSPLIDVLFALASAWQDDGLNAAGQVMADSGRGDGEDHQLFSAMAYLAARLPERDTDRQAWFSLARNRRSVAARASATAAARQLMDDPNEPRQGRLF